MPKNKENVNDKEFKHLNKNIKWTSDEISYLKENYGTASWDEIFKNIPLHNKESIIGKACSLKIRKNNFYWNDDDINILIKNYNADTSIKEIAKLLNNKFTPEAINTKAYVLGLKKVFSWTTDEIDILIKYYENTSIQTMQQLLPNRKKEAIKKKANNLGLNNRFWKHEEKQFLISEYKNYTDLELANILNKTEDGIRGKRDRLKLIRLEPGTYNYLSEFIRTRNIEWKKDSARQCKYKCVITGERFNAIHHLYGMNLILDEVFKELNMNYKLSYDDYSSDEIEIIFNKFIEIQARYPLGICLKKDIHKQFHDLYGYGNNTPDQFYKFIQDYNYVLNIA